MNTTIINKLKELKPILKERYGIEEFAVFGSIAKGLKQVLEYKDANNKA